MEMTLSNGSLFTKYCCHPTFRLSFFTTFMASDMVANVMVRGSGTGGVGGFGGTLLLVRICSCITGGCAPGSGIPGELYTWFIRSFRKSFHERPAIYDLARSNTASFSLMVAMHVLCVCNYYECVHDVCRYVCRSVWLIV